MGAAAVRGPLGPMPRCPGDSVFLRRNRLGQVSRSVGQRLPPEITPRLGSARRGSSAGWLRGRVRSSCLRGVSVPFGHRRTGSSGVHPSEPGSCAPGQVLAPYLSAGQTCSSAVTGARSWSRVPVPGEGCVELGHAQGYTGSPGYSGFSQEIA